ncbi:MAG TPA: cyclohexanecarboxyl-CoA dehydrogenase [Gammaproteobacteria bacterium]|nr:cyclohexanecarboxyl-CoA dehydrogenase [Gammaproteobacteria bacterium]
MYWTDEQKAFKETAERFAKEQLAPGYQERDVEGQIDRSLTRAMGDLGLIGVDIPEEFGGLGQTCVTSGLITETIAYSDFNMSYMCLLGSLMGQIMVNHASADIAHEWVPQLLSGEKLIALGLTEPRGGSDAGNLILRADKKGDKYILNGEKTSITFADQAEGVVLFARTGAVEDGARGISAFFVPLDLPGVATTRFNDLGSKIIGRGSIFFDNVELGEEYRLGEEGRGFVQVMEGFDFSRALIGLQCVGAAQASLDEAWQYTTEREAMGRPIAQYQGVSFPLAEGETIIESARLLCYNTLDLRDKDMPHTSEAAMCKWFAPRKSVEVIHDCLLTHGHYGWSTDLPIQQRMRDVMGLQIGDGTAQIMKLVIAREKVGRVAVQY